MKTIDFAVTVLILLDALAIYLICFKDNRFTGDRFSMKRKSSSSYQGR
jgi:hypothetical protein